MSILDAEGLRHDEELNGNCLSQIKFDSIKTFPAKTCLFIQNLKKKKERERFSAKPRLRLGICLKRLFIQFAVTLEMDGI